MSNESMKKVRGSLMMLFVAIIWGFAFIAQSDGMNYIGPFTFNFVRNLLAFIALAIYLFIKLIIEKTKKIEKVNAADKRKLWIGGILTGLALFFAASFQQTGIAFTTPGKSGFITSLYIVFVPLLSLFLHKKAGINVWVGVALAIVGFYLLCVNEALTIGLGEILVFISSIFFAIQIIVIDKFTHDVDGVKMSCIQFFVVMLLSFLLSIFEKPKIDDVITTMPSLLYVGLISGCLGYTIQIVGQKDISSTSASLILSLEAVFSLIFAMLINQEFLSVKEAIGSVLIFAAVLLSQIPLRTLKKNKSK